MYQVIFAQQKLASEFAALPSNIIGSSTSSSSANQIAVFNGTGNQTTPTTTLPTAAMPALTGDITNSAGSLSTTIANNAVTNAKAAQMATNTIKGNNTGSTANAIDLTTTQATAMLNAFTGDSGSGGVKGLVPAPASGDASAAKFLKADGTWSMPAPSGTISSYAGSTAPTGYLLCNGSAISRTTYSALFAIIGTTFGSGDGSTTFSIPDLRGYFIRGLDSGRGIDINNTSGSTSAGSARTLGSTQSNDVLSHSHTATARMKANAIPGSNYGELNGGLDGGGTWGNWPVTVTNTGGSESRPINIALNYIIKH